MLCSIKIKEYVPWPKKRLIKNDRTRLRYQQSTSSYKQRVAKVPWRWRNVQIVIIEMRTSPRNAQMGCCATEYSWSLTDASQAPISVHPTFSLPNLFFRPERWQPKKEARSNTFHIILLFCFVGLSCITGLSFSPPSFNLGRNLATTVSVCCVWCIRLE